MRLLQAVTQTLCRCGDFGKQNRRRDATRAVESGEHLLVGGWPVAGSDFSTLGDLWSVIVGNPLSMISNGRALFLAPAAARGFGSSAKKRGIGAGEWLLVNWARVGEQTFGSIIGR